MHGPDDRRQRLGERLRRRNPRHRHRCGGDWTLTFSWPTARQRLTGGWNGTWAQNGTTVTVSSSAPPAAGVDVGFTADYSGPNILPSAFTLNGVLCAAG
ncbi:cellulose binding domain-containing protein [Amycolatopsis mediterranei]|uniref:cellulose binding domain-containing protein n=1 Tax=Amycolatopsis mediterranei TaxID=33910 RepID=UPI0009B9149B|nr:cellulose binding domain-containing protein [Amycolatopsis mediterranei]UZF76306.1 cellulose binding domain-containing protein [Amycolatopsis mediterranei]